LEILKEVQTPSCRIDVIKGLYPTPVEMIFEHETNLIILKQDRTKSAGCFEELADTREFFDIGPVLFVPAGAPLRIRAEGGLGEAVRCSFTQETFSEITGSDSLLRPANAIRSLNIRDPWISGSLQKLGREAAEPDRKSTLFADALARAVLIQVSRYIEEHGPPSPYRRGGLTPKLHRKVMAYLSESDRVSIDKLSELTGYSRRHLSRAFKQTTGTTLHDAIENVRYDRARKLLTDTDLRIKEIAAKVGFSGTSSFSVAFQRISGETPHEFRARARARHTYGYG
jgi:AraC family transcriptional regulator